MESIGLHFFSSYGNFFLDGIFCVKIVLIVTLKFLENYLEEMMDKPLQEFETLGHLIHLMVKESQEERV